MEQLVIMHQNINQKFDKNKKVQATPESVALNLLKLANEKNADVIVCTEFKALDNYHEAFEKPFTEAGYVIYKNSPLKYIEKHHVKSISQVFITVKKDIVDKQKYEIKIDELDQNDAAYSMISGGINYNNIDNTPNYLRIDIEVNDKYYSVIGTRVRVLKPYGEPERKFRAKQLEVLLKSLPMDREIIMIGDLNIAPHSDYRRTDSKWHFDDVYLKSLEKAGLICHIPKEGTSPIKSEYQLDHLIASNHIKVTNIEYISENYRSECNANNIPDHSILLANIKL